MANKPKILFWKPVINYEGIYEISNEGHIRSLDRLVDFWDRHNNVFIQRLRRGRLLSPTKTRNGYLIVALYKNSKRKDISVHTLVAEAFLGLRPLGKVTNHKDGNKTNNNVLNLEWVTPSENIKHAYNVLKVGNYIGINQYTKNENK